MGKHVYCQKPLTHTVYEARLMRETGRREEGVCTQMGNQGTAEQRLPPGGRAGPGRRHRPGQGGPRLDQPARSGRRPPTSIDAAARRRRCPPHVHWDEFLGPVRPMPALRSPKSTRRVPPVQLARLVGLRHRRPRRHGLPHRQHGLHGPEARPPDAASRPRPARSTPRPTPAGPRSPTSSPPAATCRR